MHNYDLVYQKIAEKLSGYKCHIHGKSIELTHIKDGLIQKSSGCCKEFEDYIEGEINKEIINNTRVV